MKRSSVPAHSQTHATTYQKPSPVIGLFAVSLFFLASALALVTWVVN